MLLVAAVVALAWANSPFQASYRELWSTDLTATLGPWRLGLDLRGWVNEGLMAVFFLVVGLEVKRELLHGELADRRRAALPVVAAIGGMVLPALIYAVINLGSEGGARAGWGIPMATDIAFALGVLALVAPGIPASGRVFLLALAIVDDIGAILVIAIFYSDQVELRWLGLAGALVVAVVLLRRVRAVPTVAFVAVGVGLWLALHAGGVHATIAGVLMGLLAPGAAALAPAEVEEHQEELADVSDPTRARLTVLLARHSVSPLEGLEHALHPWTSIVIVPLFALANAGVQLSSESVRDAATSRVALGVLVALVVGKTLGITGAVWIACRSRVTSLPDDLGWRDVVGLASLGGIGFTVSLFITGLAFERPGLRRDATIGTFAAALLAALVATLVLRPGRRAPRVSSDETGH